MFVSFVYQQQYAFSKIALSQILKSPKMTSQKNSMSEGKALYPQKWEKRQNWVFCSHENSQDKIIILIGSFLKTF